MMAMAAAANPSSGGILINSCSHQRQRREVFVGSTTTRFTSFIPKCSSSTASATLFICPPWTGLKPISSLHTTTYACPMVKTTMRKRRGGGEGGRGGVYASLFGVGAPEALVIGVVALLVFGPKGLAEVARNLGKTLRAFQPTIRELQEVSRDFKSTLEREIGIDDIRPSTNYTYKPPSSASESQQVMVDPNVMPKTGAYTSEDILKITQEQLAASAVVPQTQTPSSQEQPQELSTPDSVANIPSEPAASTTQETIAQTSSEKTDKEK